MFVDSSAWLEFIKAGSKTEAGRRLAIALESGESVFCLAVVMQEVLQGFRTEESAAEWAELFEGLKFVPFEPLDATAAGSLYRSLRRKGVTIHTVDAQIAAVCLKHDLELLTLDKDFLKMDGLKLAASPASID